MKKIAYVGIILSLMMNPLSALEKRDCTGLKKLSKAFIACKSHNVKSGLTNVGSKVKENTIGKIKKKNDNTSEGTTTQKKDGLKEKINKKTTGFKDKANKTFSGRTKQYPKGVKK